MAIVIPIISQFVSKGFDDAENGLKKLGASTAFAAAGFAAVTAELGGALKAAIQDAAAQDRLSQQLTVSTGATLAAVAQNEDFIASLSRSVGVADDELRPALGSLVVATKDVAQAQELLQVALDVSAATGLNLSAVSDALSKGFAGNTKGLKALSPELAALIKDGADFSDVLKILEGNFGGAADAAGNTAAGQFKKLAIGMGELQEGIGAALLPVFDKLLPVLLQLSDWAQQHSTMFTVLIVAIGTLTGLMLANAAASVIAANGLALWSSGAAIASFATGVLAGEISLLNIVMAVNPIVAVAVGLVALGAAIYIAYQRSETFRAIVQLVGDALHTAFDWVVDFFAALPQIFSAAFSHVVDTITAPFRIAFNAIADLWNSTIGSLSFTLPDWIPFGLGGAQFAMPKIPTLADGGIVTGPTVALIGESGPEAVIPLSQAGGMGNTYNISVDAGLISSGVDVGQLIIDAIQRAERRSGPVFARA